MEAPVAAEPEDDFTFNLSDARKANEFNSGDIESALRFYFEGGPEPAHNQDTVTNLGAAAEDASFFDDIDNNEVRMESEELVTAHAPYPFAAALSHYPPRRLTRLMSSPLLVFQR